jgi:D-alanine-D-alanine ligase-like ATP-grasp enzyme
VLNGKTRLSSGSGSARSAPAAPKVLLVSVLPYLLGARLAIGLREVGFIVEAVCPERNPLRLLNAPPRHHRLGVLGPNSLGPWGARAAVSRAIRESEATIIIPCDDLAAAILYAVRRQGGDPVVVSRIEASLGSADAYDLLESKSAQMTLARALGLRIPKSWAVNDVASLRRGLREVGLPAFLKRDGTWAGQGVVRVRNEGEARNARDDFYQAHRLTACLRRVRTNGWRLALAGLRQAPAAMHLQEAVEGRPANHTVFCKDGEVLAAVSMLALEATAATGPASVLQRIENPEMADAASRLVSHLKVSGLLGFDFMISAAGDAYFLEINARATPACTLLTAGSTDLLGALFSARTARLPRRRSPLPTDIVAVFPNEVGRDEQSPYLRIAHHDVPADEPSLVAFGLRSVGRVAAELDRSAAPDNAQNEASRSGDVSFRRRGLVPDPTR